LRVGTADIVELPDGYAFHVDLSRSSRNTWTNSQPRNASAVRFMTTTVRAGTAGAQRVLEIGGRDAVKGFIAAEFGIRRRPTP